MPAIDAHEIFSRNHMYLLTGCHFAQNLKMVVLSLLLNLGARYCTRSQTQSGATHSQRIAYLIYIEKKSYKHYKNLHFQVCIFQDQPWNHRISSWNLPDFMKFAWFHHEICRISWILDFFILQNQYRYTVWSTTECCIFHQNQSPWHEIHQISWPWNLPDSMHEICQISP